MNGMTHYPLLFAYKDLVAGQGFLASVAIAGRALICEDEEGCWMYGVLPGGICADGDSQKEAAAGFRSTYQAALYDMVAEAPDFRTFRRQVQQFFEDEDRVLAKTWQAAVAAVRHGDLESDWLSRQPADSPRGIKVVQMKTRPICGGSAIGENASGFRRAPTAPATTTRSKLGRQGAS